MINVMQHCNVSDMREYVSRLVFLNVDAPKDWARQHVKVKNLNLN